MTEKEAKLLEELKNQVKDVTERLAELQESLSYPRPKETALNEDTFEFGERPDNGVDYFYIDAQGDINQDSFCEEEDAGFARVSIGNCFPTEEMAKKELDRRRAEHVIREWRMHNPEISQYDHTKGCWILYCVLGRGSFELVESENYGYYKGDLFSFVSREGATKCIVECRDALEILFDVREGKND